ncbi:protein HOTHEAD-like [Tripterygium wilfordii]|nr:protein HOTHEAD-like [Tripterygium wilfordii]XP_038687418.1 protein HOTHEAD-like [Tripterygium wilfordii]XP_038687419.1 protein HOTHEAD-like [Tripterygium wilfordii]XP_038687420.1 protein HOTHEAD-like [Tripterygium wilfordii]XP_038687422.1 protein HOTHEAD-like [Tripterygium wilfordii]XP_038687423.1 protein HOTHEAD-like [Tripterygium wilfordii]XP_038687424.1 protein HOTHEAD-like [Tripterygium wilfordii]
MRITECRHVISTVVLLVVFMSPLVKLSPSPSLPQGINLPYMTSNVREVSGKSFHYIIVGGGTAGCSLAATLSEKFSVLVVERGGSPYGNHLVEDKKYYGFPLILTDEFASVAQSFISKDGVNNYRGRVLGGSSAINGGFYSRASKDFVRKVGWDEGLVEEAYEWVESKIVFRPDQLTNWQSVVKLGLLEAGIKPYNGFSFEHTEGTKIGGSVFDNHGKRHTSADLLAAGNQEKITILLNATVNNIIFHKNGLNESRVGGIRFIKSNGSARKTYKAYINKPKNSNSWGEVILSAGSLGSPQILLLSGIGPYEHLNKFNIPVVVDSEGVGQGMQDNPCISLRVDIKQQLSPDPPQVVGIADDFKFIVQALILPIGLNATIMPIVAKTAFPAARGKLELNSTDPRQNPSVEFNYLENKRDLEECVKMAQLVGKVASSEAVASFAGGEPESSFISASEDELKKFCKKNVRTFYHYHGGCAVGSVVDKDYKVYGVKGLRVIDASTLLESPGTNPMATLLMLGRYQGVKMLRES